MSFLIDKGKVLPIYQRTLLDEDGNPANLTGKSVVLLELKKKGSSTVVTRTAAFVDKPNGVVQYQWINADTVDGGDFEAVWVVDGMPYPNGGYELVTVAEDDEQDPADLMFCTVAEAKKLLRINMDVDELMFAQTVIAMRCGIDLTNLDAYDDLDDQDMIGLRQATAFQARWLRGQYDYLERMNITDESADGEARSYRGAGLLLAPLVEWALQNTRFAAGMSTINTPRDGSELGYEWSYDTDERAWEPW